MKRTLAALSVLSLAFAITVAAFGQTPSARPKSEHLSKQPLNTLIATANTPAEHERIAQYYQAKALDYLAQAKEHEAMAAPYKANSSLSNEQEPGKHHRPLRILCDDVQGARSCDHLPGSERLCRWVRHPFVMAADRAERHRSDCANKSTMAPCSQSKSTIPYAG